ncbi:MAG: 5-(carboxyamino)imidazole ribonucleotide synthase [Verrucomicrobiota bacterium]|nr:5-(carboxyamino)imidazole ribonucleotide synthase [Verrucomicrobiota bacterium]
MITPGSTIGILGGGQLGRMSVLSGRRMGYKFIIYEPSAGSAAGMVADKEINASYTDLSALEAFGDAVDVVTLEFENVPTIALSVLEKKRPVHPSKEVLGTCQNRLKEKLFLRTNGIPCAPFEVVHSAEELSQAVAKLGLPCVLKTADFGYDGKGQHKIVGTENLAELWKKLGYHTGVVEKWISFQGEYSVICARNEQGEEAVFPVAENQHVHHILHTTIVPARISEALVKEAEDCALLIARKLNVIGLLAVELFLTTEGKWLVNELAPRPHNSGHYSFDACLTSQFEQHVRAVCGLPLGSTALLRPVVMINLLGDIWKYGEPDWSVLLSEPSVKLHLYDKGEPRPGRKMGHFCVLANDVEDALLSARKLEAALIASTLKK